MKRVLITAAIVVIVSLGWLVWPSTAVEPVATTPARSDAASDDPGEEDVDGDDDELDPSGADPSRSGPSTASTRIDDPWNPLPPDPTRPRLPDSRGVADDPYEAQYETLHGAFDNVVLARLPDLLRCYRKSQPTASRTITLRIRGHADPDTGVFIEPLPTFTSDFKPVEAELDACLRDITRSVELPPPGGERPYMLSTSVTLTPES